MHFFCFFYFTVQRSKKRGNVGKFLDFEKRKEIEELLQEDLTIKQIAEKLSLYASTIYREKKKCSGKYNAQEAQQKTHGYHPIDLEIIGKKFGLLTILEYTNRIQKGRTFWKARCDCGNITYISRKKLGDYCSPDRAHSCGCIAKEHAGPKHKLPIEESALRKYQDLLNFREIKSRCWEWTGYIRNGIPRTSWKNKAMAVRKCMYLIVNGTTHEPTPVHAKCRNKMCFNPDHLALGHPGPNWYE